MKYTARLFSVKEPYSEDNELFLAAVREHFAWHRNHCKDYRKIADKYGISEENLTLENLPYLPTMLFKRRSFSSAKPLISVESSGTSGNRSVIGFEAGGLLCALKMTIKILHRRKLLSLCPCRYFIMGYKPRRDNRAAVTKTAFGATLMTPAVSREYILKYTGGAYKPDFDGMLKKLVKASEKRLPVRFMGFPAYTYFLMKVMDERGIYVKLPRGSKIMLGGGWKQFYAEQPDKEGFYALAEKTLGISADNIIEFFGAVEHPVLYCDCKNHHFHVPAYSRVIIRSPDDLTPLPFGETGLTELITPMIKATPILAVMTDDLGVLHKGSECGCGINAPYLEIIGRVAPANIKTCAAGASEALKGIGL
ncbi:MAG: acyl-protein synthetase [Oscillospiraceae bacterium]